MRDCWHTVRENPDIITTLAKISYRHLIHTDLCIVQQNSILMALKVVYRKCQTNEDSFKTIRRKDSTSCSSTCILRIKSLESKKTVFRFISYRWYNKYQMKCIYKNKTLPQSSGSLCNNPYMSKKYSFKTLWNKYLHK